MSCFVIIPGIKKRGKKEAKKNPKMESKNDNKKEFSSDDESSPRTILECPVSETESDNSGSSSFISDSSENSPPPELVAGGKSNGKENQMQHHMKSMMDVFKFKSVKKLTAIPILVAASHELTKKGLTKKLARIRSAEECIDIGSIPTKPSWRNFDYAELAAATNDFSPGNNSLLSLCFFFNQFRNFFID
jgi:hypothetical protein